VKQSEKTFLSFCFEAKRNQTKKFLKQNKAKICCIDVALVRSEKFEAKRSEQKICFSREHAKRISFRFVSL
jgi:hypothetical protein